MKNVLVHRNTLQEDWLIHNRSQENSHNQKGGRYLFYSVTFHATLQILLRQVGSLFIILGSSASLTFL